MKWQGLSALTCSAAGEGLPGPTGHFAAAGDPEKHVPSTLPATGHQVLPRRGSEQHVSMSATPEDLQGDKETPQEGENGCHSNPGKGPFMPSQGAGKSGSTA